MTCLGSSTAVLFYGEFSKAIGSRWRLTGMPPPPPPTTTTHEPALFRRDRLPSTLPSPLQLIFDLFEDDDYHKVDVEVTVEASEGEGDTRTATSYVW